jgi:hypothetical protein|tara:strand:+ start:328 stop:501 length:174 start_codon:yes stop_codon:yes gene_type:complete
MPHLGNLKFKALHKQKGRLSMRRNQGKPGNVTREEFDKNWDMIFKKGGKNGSKKKKD